MTNIVILIVTILLISISDYAKGKMDKSSANLFEPVDLNQKNRKNSWSNKYSFPLIPNYKHWYYLQTININFKIFKWRVKLNPSIFKPKYKERFIFSSTALVFLTDYWHGIQFIYLNSYSIAFSLMSMYSVDLMFNTGLIFGFIYSIITIQIMYAIIFNYSYEKV